MQFVLSLSGAHVINVDPGEGAVRGWSLKPATHERLNRSFGTDVELRQCFLSDGGFRDGEFDAVYCISTLEHIPPDQLGDVAKTLGRLLAPGGCAVLTIDLFLDLAPFSNRLENVSGWNINVRELVTNTGLSLEVGDPSELNGFEEFDPKEVLARLSEYERGVDYPVVSQALLLRKHAAQFGTQDPPK